MPQEISLKRGKQENNSLALFTDISQESPVIRNAVAQSMTLLVPSVLLPLLLLFFLSFPLVCFSLFHSFPADRSHAAPKKLPLPHLSPPRPAAELSGGGGASAVLRRGTAENDFTHDITASLRQALS